MTISIRVGTETGLPSSQRSQRIQIKRRIGEKILPENEVLRIKFKNLLYFLDYRKDTL
jgi:hypothetical protein